jgi:hypothetical protein
MNDGGRCGGALVVARSGPEEETPASGHDVQKHEVFCAVQPSSKRPATEGEARPENDPIRKQVPRATARERDSRPLTNSPSPLSSHLSQKQKKT